MKKIVLLAALTIMCTVWAHAQKEMTPVSEQDVPSRMVIDFQRQQLDARSVEWFRTDSTSYEVRYLDADNDLTGIRYTPHGTETRYYMSTSNCPQRMTNTIKERFNGYRLTELCVRNVRKNTSYEARIAKTKGFLFWKKEGDVKYIHFDVNSNFIEE